jgi:tetratricopeptide (TPR) repeat protein
MGLIRKNKIGIQLLAVAACLVAFAVLVLIADSLGPIIERTLLLAPGVDKPIHFVVYLVLALILFRLTAISIENHIFRLVFSSLLALLISITDEFHQLMTPDRSFEILDIVSNVAGIATGMVLVSFRRLPNAVKLTILGICLAVTGYATGRSYLMEKDFKLAIRFERAGEFGPARDHYLKALEAGNQRPSVYNALAWVELERDGGQPRDALGWARTAFQKKPDDPDILDTFGWALHRTGNHEEALVRLEAALAGDPAIFRVHYHLAMTCLALGDEERARTHLNLQIGNNPDADESRRAERVLRELDD